jgi:hypothetical protein
MPTTVFKESMPGVFLAFKRHEEGNDDEGEIRTPRRSAGQTIGRPLYAVWLVCRSGEEPRRRLLESDARIVGEGAFVGYVLGSEGSWKVQ